MAFLTSWISNILLFILLAVVVEMLLPKTELQKYVKMVLGLLLMTILLTPIFQLFSMDINQILKGVTENSFQNHQPLENLIENKKKEIQARQDAYILEQTAVQLKGLTEKEMMEQFDLSFVDIQIELKNNNYQIPEDIEKIKVILRKEKNHHEISAIKEVKIDMNEPNEGEKEDLQRIARLLSINWGVDMDQLEIAIEGGIGDQ